MPDTAVVWFRRDLRVRDLPALAHACREHERVVPLFVFDPALLRRALSLAMPARRGCSGCLRGARRRAARPRRTPGAPPRAPARPRCAASRPRSAPTPCTSPTTSRASRGRATHAWSRRSGATGCSSIRHPGLYVADLAAIRTTAGGPYTVYSPFLRAWKAQERRPVERAPQEIAMPRIAAGRLPSLRALGFDGGRAAARRPPGARRARPPGAPRAAGSMGRGWSATPSAATNSPSRPRACRPTCASAASRRSRSSAPRPPGAPRATATSSRGATSSARWRCTSPTPRASSSRSATATWSGTPTTSCSRRGARAGPASRSSTPRCASSPPTGWMHNRARMIVGSFLTKDLQQDWREGERHFMAHLLDGDVPNNNGGWQWIASTGTDPTPYFQRLFNPMTQQRRFDADGRYVRRWCPELRRRARRQARRAVDDERRRAAGRGLSHRARLPRADRRPRRGAAAGDRALSGASAESAAWRCTGDSRPGIEAVRSGRRRGARAVSVNRAGSVSSCDT